MFKWIKAQEKNEYYRVYLHGPEEMFRKSGYLSDRSEIFTSCGYMTIYCKNANGVMVDVLTNKAYVHVDFNTSEEKYAYITYSYKKTATVEQVYKDLRDVDSYKIKCYTDAINKLEKWTRDRNLDYLNKQREQQIWEDTREEREAGYEEFINNLHKNYGNPNTESNDGVKKKEKKRWNIFNWYL